MKSLSPVRLFMTPWTVAHQAPPSMEFSRQEYWSGLPFPSLTISIIIFNISGGTIPVKGKCLLIDKKQGTTICCLKTQNIDTQIG